ncbi:hypothetical protein Gohar_022961 [Gossypium harknessii]|uniref:C2H2-type domain-containing protein n=1 Tax=Gossypium harknessii TaxID=34285 RepID=A0A7J9HBE3_9ROSI|nr:hypothetical protein [Gossypium harknessii]
MRGDSDIKSAVMVPAGSSFLAFLGGKYLNTQETKTLPDSRNRVFCTYCSKWFKSNKALAGHLRIHSQHPPMSKTEGKHFQEGDDDDSFFGCFDCDASFSSMKLLCQHMRLHRDTDSNGVHQPAMPQESNSLSEAATTFKQGTGSTVSPRDDHHNIDLLKDFNDNWSRTEKRGSKRTASEHDIIYNAEPFRVYSGRMKTEETSMESEWGAADNESTVELSGNRVKTRDSSNKSKSRSCHGRRSVKKTKAVKSVHRCEICDKTYETGQALGGHKSYHRVKDPLKQRKTEQQSCGEVKMVTRMVLPGLPPEEADKNPSKRMLDFDFNIPYEE